MEKILRRLLVVILTIAAPALRLHADPDADIQDNDHSSYHQALLNYKDGNYEAARLFIDTAEKDAPGNIPVELLKARILTELHDYKRAGQVLGSVSDNPEVTPMEAQALSLTYGDLALRQHHFGVAAKYYESLLAQTPDDPDLILKLVYTGIGVSDLVAAGKYASSLEPLDATHPSYYFARAALARVTGNSGEEEQDIGQARTIYGITMTNRYLKTYLEVFAADKSSISTALNPPATTTNAAPSGTTP